MKKITLIIVLIFCLSVTTQAKTQTIEHQQGVVINLAGKQRMLTQKMSKEALLIAKGIDVEKNKKNLKKTIELFDKTLKGLYNGDRELNLPKTKDREILRQLDLVSILWRDFKKDVDMVAQGRVEKSILESIDKKNIPLLNNMNIVVQMYEDSSNSNLDPQIAKTINLAGRQRMLTQKMTKELLLIANSLKSDENERSLKSTGELFKDTLIDLMTNNKEAMSDPQISKKLSNVKNLWEEYQNIIANSELSQSGQRKSKAKQDEISSEITRELLSIANRVDARIYTKNLKKTGELFDKTLIALIKGDANLGLAGTKDSKILKQLGVVQKLWDEYKSVIANADISENGLKKAMRINMPLLKNMNKVVKMYEEMIE
jgi:hypothetical protein